MTIKDVMQIEGNESSERQNYESFLQNIGHVTKHFSRTFSELENILSEKHDITFFTGYKTLQGDIKHLDNVPEPPTTVEVKSFDKRMFYKEIVDYIQSKVDDSICKHCDEKTMTIGEMQKEQMNLEQKLNRSIKKKDDELKMFKQKIESLEKKSRDAELRATQDIQKKDEELNILRQEKESLKNRKAEIPEKEEVDEPDQETEM
ncbi:GRIP and coiled-coil domain-containing protein 2-like [Mytilus trossulus]|uniref:GRIP and coiled-coil domain-containing protein 2-like n=1 Tax=Mytilus trossulus TaxID=6551 RepID=UPI00300458C9